MRRAVLVCFLAFLCMNDVVSQPMQLQGVAPNQGLAMISTAEESTKDEEKKDGETKAQPHSFPARIKEFMKNIPSTGNETADKYIDAWVYVVMLLSLGMTLFVLLSIFAIGRMFYRKFTHVTGDTSWHLWALYYVPQMAYTILSSIFMASIFFGLATVVANHNNLTSVFEAGGALHNLLDAAHIEISKMLRDLLQDLERPLLEIKAEGKEMTDELKKFDANELKKSIDLLNETMATMKDTMKQIEQLQTQQNQILSNPPAPSIPNPTAPTAPNPSAPNPSTPSPPSTPDPSSIISGNTNAASVGSAANTNSEAAPTRLQARPQQPRALPTGMAPRVSPAMVAAVARNMLGNQFLMN